MNNEVVTGKASFTIEVPYKIIEKGRKGEEKPLIVYLHGYNQNIEYFEKKMRSMLTLEAYHLFIQAPYPIYDSSRKLKVSRWGRAWYLYDGEQQQFLKSLEKASGFIDNVIEDATQGFKSSRTCVLGYSMGGYLSGYYALSRPQNVDDLIVISGRIKTEAFEGRREQASHLNVLAVHGSEDASVYPEPQKKCIELLHKEGFNTTFIMVDEGHKLVPVFVEESKDWLLQKSYRKS
ncbi:alpha/beta hydrolase [Gracilimonas sp.]|uniref:alpha/beta hydrolase n=1 Tax=Gracilimonas sp. TaxID=1974203 RepID=UPI002871FF06|nr:hypothetical protein [Gracilimonas sp.]